MDNKKKDFGSLSFVILVTLVAALGGLLFGYDTAVISGAIGFLQLHFDLTPAMKGWTASSALIGCVIGVIMGGFMSDRFGRKKTLIISAVAFLVSAIGTAVPKSLVMFIIFRIVGGVGVGAASMTSPMYIAEISPTRIRGRMVSVNQFAIISGMLLVYFVNYFIVRAGDQLWNISTGWRWMFGSESVPAVTLLISLFFVPESPRWLFENGQRTKAMDIFSKINGVEKAKHEILEIKKILEIEQGTFMELFQKTFRPVLFLGIFLAVFQQITGINVFLYYAPEIFKGVAGSSMNAALLQTIVIGITNLFFTIIAIWTVDKIGRKPLMIFGSLGMGISLVALGVGAYYNKVGVWLLFFMIAYIASFALSLGPVVWVILSEIFPTKIRGRALGLAAFCLWLSNFVVSQTFPMMDENKWLIKEFNHAFPFWLYGFFCFVIAVVVFVKLPETKGKTLEEIECSWMGFSDENLFGSR